VLADPQSVTINAVAVSLPRTGVGAGNAVYTSSDGNVSLAISHQYGAKRTRRNIRINHRKVAPDPFNSAYNAEYSMSCFLVIDHPKVGYTATEAKQIVDALTAYLTASSGAKVTAALGGES
jgi:hypothetical protein